MENFYSIFDIKTLKRKYYTYNAFHRLIIQLNGHFIIQIFDLKQNKTLHLSKHEPCIKKISFNLSKQNNGINFNE